MHSSTTFKKKYVKEIQDLLQHYSFLPVESKALLNKMIDLTLEKILKRNVEDKEVFSYLDKAATVTFSEIINEQISKGKYQILFDYFTSFSKKDTFDIVYLCTQLDSLSFPFSEEVLNDFFETYPKLKDQLVVCFLENKDSSFLKTSKSYSSLFEYFSKDQDYTKFCGSEEFVEVITDLENEQNNLEDLKGGYFDDMAKQLVHDIFSIPVLSAKETQNYLTEYFLTKDHKIKDKILQGNMRLVLWAAKKYGDPKIPVIDSFQEATIGLLKAIDDFDFSYNTSFSTYAIFKIRGQLMRFSKNTSELIRLPVYYQQELSKVNRVRALYQKKLFREPTLEELEKETKISIERLKKYLEEQVSVVSYNQKIDDGDSNSDQLLDFLADDNLVDGEWLIRKELKGQLEKFLNKFLSEKEIFVLKRRFGIDCDECKTFADIGEELSCTRQYVQYLEKNAIGKLRKSGSALRIFIDYLDDEVEARKKLKLFQSLSIKEAGKADVFSRKSDSERLNEEQRGKVLEFFRDYTYDQLLNSFNRSLSLYQKQLLAKYCRSNKEKVVTVPTFEKEVNLLLRSRNRDFVPSWLLAETYNQNKDEFSTTDQFLVENFLLDNPNFSFESDIAVQKLVNQNTSFFFEKRLEYNQAHLEKLYYHLNKFFQQRINDDVAIELLENPMIKLTSDQRLVLEYYFGYRKDKKYKITEISKILDWKYEKTRDVVNNGLDSLIRKSLNFPNLRKDVDIYRDCINNPLYELSTQVRDMLRGYVFDEKSYQELAKEFNLSSAQVSNSVTGAFRQLDFYRYNIYPTFSLTEEDIVLLQDKIPLLENEFYLCLVRKHFMEGIPTIELTASFSTSEKVTVNQLFRKIKLTYLSVHGSKKISDAEYQEEILKHWTDSIITDAQKKLLSQLIGLKCRYNPEGRKLSKNEFCDEYQVSINWLKGQLNSIKSQMQARKLNISYPPMYGIIEKDKILEILEDPRLPISDDDRLLLYHLKTSNSEEDISRIAKEFSITEKSISRKYQRACLTILQYLSGEKQPIYSFEHDILPIYRYFSKFDQKILEYLYKDHLTTEQLSKKMAISLHTAYDHRLRIENNLGYLFNNRKEFRAFDFELARNIYNNSDLPYSGDVSFIYPVFQRVFGEKGELPVPLTVVLRELNIKDSRVVSDDLYEFMLAVMKYKDGYRKGSFLEAPVSNKEIFSYWKSNSDKLSQVEEERIQFYLSVYKKNPQFKFGNSEAVLLSSDFYYKIWKEKGNLEFCYQRDGVKVMKKLYQSLNPYLSEKAKNEYHLVLEQHFVHKLSQDEEKQLGDLLLEIYHNKVEKLEMSPKMVLENNKKKVKKK